MEEEQPTVVSPYRREGVDRSTCVVDVRICIMRSVAIELMMMEEEAYIGMYVFEPKVGGICQVIQHS